MQGQMETRNVESEEHSEDLKSYLQATQGDSQEKQDTLVLFGHKEIIRKQTSTWYEQISTAQ